jgi:lipopolysaccharide heptosyltransferase I
MPQTAPVTGSPRILIVRLSALGDVIHGLPVACALREAMPEAAIGWVVEGRNADLIDGHPAIDHIIRAPRGWWKSPAAIFNLRRRLRILKFDVTVDLQCLTKSAVVAWLSGATRRIGKAGVHGRELSKWFHNELVAVEGEHVIDHYLETLRPLGITSPRVRFDLPEHDEDGAMAEQLMRTFRMVPRRFAVLNPGAGWNSKIWPPERYGDVARRLLTDFGMPSLAVWGSASEEPLAEAIVASSKGAAKLSPPTTVAQLAAICRRAALFLGSDTGPMHLAVAVGTPTISMHGPSRAEWCGAYGRNNIRLQARYEHGSSQERRQADDAAMRAITVDMAYGACRELLDRSPLRRAG